MTKNHTFIIAFGTNVAQQNNMLQAKKLLTATFSDIVFSTEKWTHPLGIDSDLFLNSMAIATCQQDFQSLMTILKNIEQQCGNKRSLRSQSIIVMDIDLLQYDQHIFHNNDWQRDYIQQLYSEIKNKL